MFFLRLFQNEWHVHSEPKIQTDQDFSISLCKKKVNHIKDVKTIHFAL